MHYICTGNWSDGLRKIIRSCNQHHDLDPETYVQQDPEDSHGSRSFEPEELRPLPPPSGSPASRLLPDPSRKRMRHTNIEEDKENVEEEEQERPRRKQIKVYDPLSEKPTRLAIRRTRRK